MAMKMKKIDLSGVKEFLFHYGERVALFTCIGVALALLIWGIAGAAGPGTTNGDPWDKTLSGAATKLKQQIPPPSGVDENDIASKIAFQPMDWRNFDSRATPGPYQQNPEVNDLLMRGSPTILAVLPGDENWQMDLIDRGYLRYEVKQGMVLAVGGNAPAAGGEMKGPPGVGVPGNQGGGGGGAPNLAQVLMPRHLLVVTGIFPMKKQVDEFVQQLRLRSVAELMAQKEMPVILGINVYRAELGPDGNRTHKEVSIPLISYNYQLAKPYVDPTLNKELSESIFDLANPRAIKPLVHEGLVTPLPKLPPGIKYPDVRISTPYWPNLKDLVADATEPGAGPPLGGMPMPKGGSGQPPPILGGKKDPKDPKGGMNEPGPEVPTHAISLKKEVEKTNKELYERLANNNFNIFHPLGQFPEGMPGKDGPAPATGQQGGVERFLFGAPEGGGSGGANMPNMPNMPAICPREGSRSAVRALKPGGDKPGEKPGPATASSFEINDKIVRFVDVDVKPGHTYKYYIKVRVANPNYGKRNEVHQQVYADAKELLSDGEWTETPAFKVPETFHLYAVDQYQVDLVAANIANEKDPKTKKKIIASLEHDHAVVQLHRWFGQTGSNNDPYLIGDWAIAERVIVRKGAHIAQSSNGQSEIPVEIPTWNKGKGAFEMRQEVVKGPKGKGPQVQNGVTLDFVPLVLAPDGKRYSTSHMLVDFEGGKLVAGGKDRRFPSLAPITEDAAMDLLMLTPDGRLIVQNTRADMEVEIKDGSAPDTYRQTRVVNWRQRNVDALTGGGGAGPGAPPGGRAADSAAAEIVGQCGAYNNGEPGA